MDHEDFLRRWAVVAVAGMLLLSVGTSVTAAIVASDERLQRRDLTRTSTPAAHDNTGTRFCEPCSVTRRLP